MIADPTVGWTLVHFLWQGTALAAMVGIVMAATRSPRVRYVAGCTALGLMAIVPVVTYLVLRQSGAAPELGPLFLTLGPGNGLSGAVAAVEPTNWVSWLPDLWLAGVSALSARLMLAFWGVHRLTHREATLVANEWRHLSERLGLTRAVTFLSSPRIASPVQAGFLKPVVLLPASLVLQLPAAQVEAIVAHELAHIRRHDYQVNLLQSVVEILLFYHPAVWWVSRVVRVEREVCCDLMAAAATGGRREYAEALVALEQLASENFSLTMAASGGDLRVRIARLLGHSASPVRFWGLPAVLVVLVLAAAMAFPLFESRAQNPAPAPAATATPIPVQVQVPLTHEVGALQQENGRLQRELAALRAETAARVQQKSDAERLSAQVAELLAEAQRSLSRSAELQADVIRAKTLADEASRTYTMEHPVMRDRLAQLRGAITELAQAEHSSAYARWLHEDVVYIISYPEVTQFMLMGTDAEKEDFIERFWKRRDPNPATEVNEMKEEHYRRIAQANKRFSTEKQAGWRTERGRMYILRGRPDVIESYPSEGREKWIYRFGW